MGDKSAGEGRPPPSPLTGGYLLIVLPQAHLPQHKDNVLHNLTKGLITWDKEDCHVDLEKELDTITSQAPEGEEAKNGERLIQFASENLVTEVLIHPQLNTLTQCLRNLLSSFTRHRHIIHAGYTCAGNGAWMLQDGTYSFADFAGMYQEIEVQRVLRAYENTVTVDVHCCQEGDWNNLKGKDPFSKVSRVRLNPNDKLSASKSIHGFVDYLKEYIVSACLDELLESSEVVGNIRFSHPTLYVFPGGQGDAALFGINGFNMLVDGGFARKACFWDFTRHLDRLDAVLMTRINNGNVLGLSSLLQRKKIEHVYPQIGHFFCNIQEKKHLLSPDGDKDKDPLLINLIDYGHEMISNLKHIQLKPQACFRESSLDPINLYHKVGHGKLDMYVLSPSKDSREVRDFMVKWNTMDSKIFCSYNRRGGEFNFPLCNRTSICALLVWQPANPEDNITRILFPGSTPQNKIFEGLDRLKNLEFMKHAVCSAKTLSPSPSSVGLNIRSVSRKAPLIEKVEDVKKEAVKPVVKSLEKVQKQPVKPSKPKPTEKPKDKPKTDVETKPETVKNETIKTEAVQKVEKKEKPKKLAQKQPEKKITEKKIEKKEVKSSPTTPKKVVENKDEKPAKSRSSTRTRASPSATPAKSAKEANNRKVLEQKTRETRSQKVKKEEKKPEKTAKKPTSPSKKPPSPVKAKPPAVKRPESKKKEVPTDSAVSTPSEKAKDITEVPTVEEEKPLSSREDEEDILIVEKVEIEIPQETKEEAEKKEELLDVQQSVDSKSPIELKTESQETSAGINNLPSEKITPKDKEVKERSNEIIEQKQEESQPDEKFSTTVESGQTTTAPTLPEDERIPPEDVKEPEEKHVEEEKEKEKPKPDQPSLPEVPAIPITFDQRAQLLKDIVKTPDEVADLPVHEEADGGFYEGKLTESREDLLEIPAKRTKNETEDELKFIKDGFEKEDKSKDLKEDFDQPEGATESSIAVDDKKLSEPLKDEAETKLPKDILKYEATLLDDDAIDEEKDKETEKESLEKLLHEEKCVSDTKEKETNESVIKEAAEAVINEAVEDTIAETVIKPETVIKEEPKPAEEPKKEEKSIFGFISKTASDLKDKISEKFSDKVSKEAEEWASVTDKITTELHVVERLKEEAEIKLAVESQIQEENVEVEADIETQAAHEIIEPELSHVKEETEVPIYDDIPKDMEEILRKGSLLKDEDVTLPDKEVYDIMQTKDGIISEIETTVIKESLPGTIIEPSWKKDSPPASPGLRAKSPQKSPSPELRLNGEDKAKIDGEHKDDGHFDISADSPADIYKRDSLISQVDTKSETSREVSPIPNEGKIDHEKFEDKETLKKELEASLSQKKIELPEALPLPPREDKEPEKPEEKKPEKKDEAASSETLTAKQEVMGKISPALTKMEGILEEAESKTSTPEIDLKHESPIPSSQKIPSPEAKSPIPAEPKSSPTPATETATPQKSPSPISDQKLPQAESVQPSSPVEKEVCKFDMKDVLSSKSPSPKLEEKLSKSPSPVPAKIEESTALASEKQLESSITASKSPSPAPEQKAVKEEQVDAKPEEKLDISEVKSSPAPEEQKADAKSPVAEKLEEHKVSPSPTADRMSSPSAEEKLDVHSKSPSPTTEKLEDLKASFAPKESSDAKSPSPQKLEEHSAPSPTQEKLDVDKLGSKSPSPAKDSAPSTEAEKIASDAKSRSPTPDVQKTLQKSTSKSPSPTPAEDAKSPSPVGEPKDAKSPSPAEKDELKTEVSSAVSKSPSPAPAEQTDAKPVSLGKMEEPTTVASKSPSPTPEKAEEQASDAKLLEKELKTGESAVSKSPSPTPQQAAKSPEDLKTGESLVSKSPSPPEEHKSAADAKSPSPVLEKVEELKVGVVTASKSPSPIPEDHKAGKSPSPVEEVKTAESSAPKSPSPIPEKAEDAKSSLPVLEELKAGESIVSKSPSPTPEKDQKSAVDAKPEETATKSPSPTLEKEGDKQSVSDAKSSSPLLEKQEVESTLAHKSPSPTPEKAEEHKSAATKSPSPVLDDLKTGESNISKSPSPTPGKVEEQKSADDKAPSPVEELKAAESTVTKSRSPTPEKDQKSAIDTKSPSPVLDDLKTGGSNVSKSPSPTPGKVEEQKSATDAKAPSPVEELKAADSAVSKSPSPTPEKAEQHKSAIDAKSPSPVMDELKTAESAVTKSPSPTPEKAEDAKPSSALEELKTAESTVTKSPSPTPEKAEEQKSTAGAKSPSPVLEELKPTESTVSKSPSPTPEKAEAQKSATDAKSPSPVQEKQDELKTGSTAASKSPSPTPEKAEEQKAIDAKSPSPVLEELKAAESAVSKSPSPTPEKVEEKKSDAKSPSPMEKLETSQSATSKSPSPTPPKTEEQKSVSDVKSPSPELTKTGADVTKTPSPTPEKVDEPKLSDAKSPSPVLEKQELKPAESMIGSKSPSPAPEEQKSAADVQSSVEKLETLSSSPSPAPENVEEQKSADAKSPSPVLDELKTAESTVSKSPSPTPEKAEDAKSSSALEELKTVESTITKSPSPTPEKAEESAAAAKSPSPVLEELKPSESITKSPSPTPEKAEDSKPSSALEELKTAESTVTKSPSPTPEKAEEKSTAGAKSPSPVLDDLKTAESTVTKSPSPTPEKAEEHKSTAGAKSPSPMLDDLKTAESTVTKSPSPTPEKAEDAKSSSPLEELKTAETTATKSPSPTPEKAEEQKSTAGAKSPSPVLDELKTTDSTVTKSPSPTPGESTDAKSPLQEGLKGEESNVTKSPSPIPEQKSASDAKSSSPVLEELKTGLSTKSPSPTPEKAEQSAGQTISKSPSPLPEQKEELKSATDAKSPSPAPEKLEEPKAVSKSPSPTRILEEPKTASPLPEVSKTPSPIGKIEEPENITKIEEQKVEKIDDSKQKILSDSESPSPAQREASPMLKRDSVTSTPTMIEDIKSTGSASPAAKSGTATPQGTPTSKSPQPEESRKLQKDIENGFTSDLKETKVTDILTSAERLVSSPEKGRKHSDTFDVAYESSKLAEAVMSEKSMKEVEETKSSILKGLNEKKDEGFFSGLKSSVVDSIGKLTSEVSSALKSEETKVVEKSAEIVEEVLEKGKEILKESGSEVLVSSTITALKKEFPRSTTPSDIGEFEGRSTPRSDISSGQVTSGWGPTRPDSRNYDTDEEIPSSPMSVASHVPSPPHFDYEKDSMTSSVYGALPDDFPSSSDPMYTSMYVSKDDDLTLDKEMALKTNEPEKGESSKDPIAKWGKPLGLPPPPIFNSPQFTYWNPYKEWGEPLGLPSPAPPPREDTDVEVDTSGSAKTTPKKVAKMNAENNKLALNTNTGKEVNNKTKRSDSPVKRIQKEGRRGGSNSIYLDLSYVPHHGNSHYANVEFFKRIRARYYVFSGTEPSKEVFNALLEAKQTWEDKDLEVTIIPTYDTDTLGYWIAENEETLSKYKIDLSPSASRCTINLQDHDTSCSAYRLEF